MSSVRNLAIAMGAMLVLVMVFVSPAAAQTYAVTFTESGLPAGTQWTVALTGVGTMSSTTITITFPAVSPGGRESVLLRGGLQRATGQTSR